MELVKINKKVSWRNLECGVNKRGQQMMGLPFGMIFSLFLIVIFIVVAFVGIKSFWILVGLLVWDCFTRSCKILLMMLGEGSRVLRILI